MTFSRAGFLTLVIIAAVVSGPDAPSGAGLRDALLLGLVVSTPWMLPTWLYAAAHHDHRHRERPDRIGTGTMGGPGCRRRTGDSTRRWSAWDLGQNVLALNRERGPTWRMVHNVYLQYAVDLGVPGLLLFLWLFVTVFRRVRRVRRLSTRIPTLYQVGVAARGVQIALCAFAVSALFYPVAYQFYFFLIAGLGLAVANVCARRSG